MESKRERFLVGASPTVVRALAEVFENDPEIDLVRVSGPSAAPERLVAVMSTDRADLLQQTFRDQVVIEPDSELDPLAAAGPPQRRRRAGAMPPAKRKPNGQPSAVSAAVEEVGVRDRQYLIAKQDALLPAGVAPLDVDALLGQLDRDPAITVERTLEPQRLELLANTPTTLQKIIVARMPDQKAAELDLHPQVLLEEDELVRPLPTPGPELVNAEDPGVFLPFGTSSTWRIRVEGPDGSVVPNASVFIYGSGIPAQGRTGPDGIAELSLLNESDASLHAMYINPQSDYWSLWLERPLLRSEALNTVVLTPLAQSLPGFPDRQVLGWGQRAMRLDQVPTRLDGAGIRVAVIDSGAAAGTHPDLTDIHAGQDLTVMPASDEGWNVDTIAHGSHCSGVIAGRDDAGGIRGFAPRAVMHELRIFPGGRVSSLLDAIDYCIDRQIDVVNMSLGSGGTSQLLLQKLAQAKQLGVACIVAAGNSGGEVQFPGSSTDVLTVSAIGKLGEFPPTSYHAQQVLTDMTTAGGFFAAKFSCHGPEIDVCGPGVAIVSSVPERGYASWDGTSMATPHVSGLAALVLAHHPDFQASFRDRNGARVDRLFTILKASTTPVDVGDPQRTGAGLPDALRALQLDASTPPRQPGAGNGQQPTDLVRALLEQLRQDLIAVGILPSVAPASVGEPLASASAGRPAAGQPAAPSNRPVDPAAGARAALASLRAAMEQVGLLSNPNGPPAEARL